MASDHNIYGQNAMVQNVITEGLELILLFCVFGCYVVCHSFLDSLQDIFICYE